MYFFDGFKNTRSKDGVTEERESYINTGIPLKEYESTVFFSSEPEQNIHREGNTSVLEFHPLTP